MTTQIRRTKIEDQDTTYRMWINLRTGERRVHRHPLFMPRDTLRVATVRGVTLTSKSAASAWTEENLHSRRLQLWYKLPELRELLVHDEDDD